MNELTTRIISGIVYIILFVFCVYYGEQTFIGLISFFSIIGLWEFSKLTQHKSFIPYIILLIFLLGSIKITNEKMMIIPLAFSLIGLLILVSKLYKKKTNFFDYKSEIKKNILSIFYIILPFTFLVKLPFLNNAYQPQIIMGIIILIWSNDSFAYVTGKFFGKHKLFERISPKKTIEGFLGGLIFCSIAGIIISHYFSVLTSLNWITVAILVSIFGTYGDLVESIFKRIAKVKDSGTIMPGHGGILDRLDSLFFLAPFVYLYIHFII